MDSLDTKTARSKREHELERARSKVIANEVRKDPRLLRNGLLIGLYGSPIDIAVEALRNESATPEQIDAQTVQANGKSLAKRPKPRVNARMLETIQRNTETMGWNSTEWARHLKCAKSSVVETAAWKDLTIARERAKAERATDRRRRRLKGI